MMMAVLLFLLGSLLGLIAPPYLYNFLDKRNLRKELMDLVPVDVDDDKLCKDRHDWSEATYLEDSTQGSITVCTRCGFIPSLDKMATNKTLKKIKENSKVRAFEKQVDLEFEAQELDMLAAAFEAIKKEPTLEVFENVYKNGRSYSKRYAIFKIVKAEQVKVEDERR